MIYKVQEHLSDLAGLCRAYRVKRLEVFGSASTGERFQDGRSDLDFLVEFMPMPPKEHADSYFGFLEKLQDLFGCPIDLIEIKAVRNPYFLEEANRSRTEIYAA